MDQRVNAYDTTDLRDKWKEAHATAKADGTDSAWDDFYRTADEIVATWQIVDVNLELASGG